MRVAGRVIVVTGAGSGIGRAVALEALRRGATVAAVDRNETTLEETAALAVAGDRLATYPLDITDKAAVAALPARVAERFGAVDGLIHCAGIIQPFVKVKDLDDDAIASSRSTGGAPSTSRGRACRSSSSGPPGISRSSRAWAASCRCLGRRSTAPRRPP
jgi:NAD(P)-dependent dehydrogenase (short-subunit alcohol dehydrogenase family)